MARHWFAGKVSLLCVTSGWLPTSQVRVTRDRHVTCLRCVAYPRFGNTWFAAEADAPAGSDW